MERERHALRVAFAAEKGGVGKTISSFSIASCFQKLGYKVLLIDFDTQANSTSQLLNGRPSPYTILDVLLGRISPKEAIVETMYGIDLIGSKRSALAELDLNIQAAGIQDDVKNYVLSDICVALDNNYDFIIIDCLPGVGTALDMAYFAADYIMSPTRSDANSIDGVINTYKAIQKFKKENPDFLAKMMGVVITSYNSRTNTSKYALMQLQSSLSTVLDEDAIFETISQSNAVELVTRSKGTLNDLDPKCKPAREYMRLARKMIDYFAHHEEDFVEIKEDVKED